MNYLEALDRLSEFRYLLNKKIKDKKTGVTSVVSIISIVPEDQNGNDKFNWLNPLDRNYSLFLSDKKCAIIFVLDYNRLASFKGTFFLESQIGKFELPDSNISKINATR